MIDTTDLHDTTDAAVWAAEFCKRWPSALCQIEGKEGVEDGEDFEATMIGWFANAIMAGVGSEASKRDALEAEVERLREALEWFEKHRLDAIARAEVIHAPEDEAVLALCKRHGFGAVMDSASRQWAKMPEGKTGAFFIGGCIGDTTARAALAQEGGE